MAVQTQIQVRRGTAATWTSTNPILAAGEIGFETDTGKFKIGNGSSTWTGLSYAGGGQNTITTYNYTATAGQTTFSGADNNSNTLSYTAGALQVFLNGVMLVPTTDYTASNGTSIVLASGAVVGDALIAVALGSFTVSTDIAKSTLTAKGSLVGATAASTPANISVGTDGQVLTADSTQSTGVKWGSVPGAINWTQRVSSGASGYAFQQVAYNGSNLYVAVGQAGVLYSSPDGITWTSRTSGFGTQTINDVAYGNSLWVAVGNNGLISTSTDGITWTARTANMSTNAIKAVTYANSLWVAVGAGGGTTNTGGITYSSDGTTWTRKSQSLTVGTTYYCVAWNGTNWLVGANVSTNNYLYATTPSGTWTAAATGGGAPVSPIYWDGTRAIFGENGYWYYTTSTTLASSTQIFNPGGVTGSLGSSKYYNGKIYFSANMYIQSLTTASSQYPDESVPIITPGSYIDSVGNLTGSSYLWYGAAGYIVLDRDSGRIWTSF